MTSTQVASPTPPAPPTGLSHRAIALLLALVAVTLLASSDVVHGAVIAAVDAASPVIVRHPVLGAILFVILSALAAILVFFSSVVIVPVGIQVWGQLGCFLLMWSGWVLGGLVTYAIGRRLGRPGIEKLLSAKRLDRYAAHAPLQRSFAAAVLIQIVLPSDVSGYFFGLIAFPLRTYLGALMVAELPYAIATVFLGVAFMERQYTELLSIAAVFVVMLTLVWLRRRGWHR